MKTQLLKLWLGAGVVLVGGLGVLAAACSSSPAAKAAPGGTTGSDDEGGVSPPAPGPDAGDDAADDAPGPAPQTFVRVAHVSPDSPALDVCVAPHGTTAFQGPLVGQLAATFADDAGPEDAAALGLSYGQVSAYIPLAPGQYDVVLVAAGASSCAAALPFVHVLDVPDGGDDAGSSDAAVAEDAGAVDAGSPDASVDAAVAPPTDAGQDASVTGPSWTNLPTLAFNTYATLLVAGDLSPAGSDAPLTVTILPDDAVLAGGNVVLRAVNAVPSTPALDFGLSSISEWMPLFTGVSFAAASAHVGFGDGALDANGYLSLDPLAGQAMSARPASSDGGVTTGAASNVEIDQGAIATVIAIGGKTGDSANPPALLLCVDNQPSGGLLSDCSVAQ